MSKEMTKNKLVKALNTVGTKLDTNMTGNYMGEFGCADIFGTKYKGTNPTDLLSNMKALGVDVSGVSYDKPFWYIGEVLEEGIPVKEEPLDDTVEDEPVEEVFEAPLPVEDNLVSEPSVVEDPDWEWISTLKNNKTDKVKLDAYAEKFNVKLNQRSTLSNMISDFKDKTSA